MPALTPLLAQAASPAMTTGGWILMILAWIFVTGLLAWCFWRVLGGGPKKAS